MSTPRDDIPHVSYYLPKGRRRWRVAFSIDGRRHFEKGGMDEESTRRIARRVSEKLELHKAGHLPLDQIVRWAGERKSLEAHLKDFANHLRQLGRTPGYVAGHEQKVRDLFQLAGVRSVQAVTADALLKAANKMRAAGTSLQTINHYLAAAKQFTRWLAHPKRRRIAANPLADALPLFNARTDRRHPRRALTVEEADRLLGAVAAAGRRRGGVETEPADRAMIYRLALETGLRANEIRVLTVSQFVLAGDQPRVVYDAGDDKAGRGGSLPLRRKFAAELAAHFGGRGRAGGDVAFPRMPEKPVRMLRRDLKRAGVEYLTREGYADFHSLRHTCGSWLLAKGVNPKVVQEIMRHSDISLTMNLYGHAFQGDLRKAVELDHGDGDKQNGGGK